MELVLFGKSRFSSSRGAGLRTTAVRRLAVETRREPFLQGVDGDGVPCYRVRPKALGLPVGGRGAGTSAFRSCECLPVPLNAQVSASSAYWNGAARDVAVVGVLGEPRAAGDSVAAKARSQNRQSRVVAVGSA